jgi:hypothetical protein
VARRRRRIYGARSRRSSGATRTGRSGAASRRSLAHVSGEGPVCPARDCLRAEPRKGDQTTQQPNEPCLAAAPPGDRRLIVGLAVGMRGAGSGAIVGVRAARPVGVDRELAGRRRDLRRRRLAERFHRMDERDGACVAGQARGQRFRHQVDRHVAHAGNARCSLPAKRPAAASPSPPKRGKAAAGRRWHG